MLQAVFLHAAFQCVAGDLAVCCRGTFVGQQGVGIGQQALQPVVRDAVFLVNGLRFVIGVAQDTALAAQVGQADIGQCAPGGIVAILAPQSDAQCVVGGFSFHFIIVHGAAASHLGLPVSCKENDLRVVALVGQCGGAELVFAVGQAGKFLVECVACREPSAHPAFRHG